jgi:hypothetical protein
MIRLCALIMTAAGLASCTTGPAMMQAELDALVQECAARGGVLTPRPGPPVSGNERANHFCQIPGGASRIQR